MLNGILAHLKSLSKTKDFNIITLLAGVYFLLGFRFFHFTLKYTYNFPFWDEWDLVEPLLNSSSVKLLFLQHNEHHHGVGFVLGQALLTLSNWNVRTEALMVSLIIFSASVVALGIKKRIYKELTIFDIAIPVIFLTLYQWQNLIWGFQIGFVLPLFFLMLSVYLFTLSASSWRDISLVIIAFLSTYSAFHGLFVAFLITIFFLLQIFGSKLPRDKVYFISLGLLTTLISLSYFYNYLSVPSLGQKTFSFFVFLAYVFLNLSNSAGITPELHSSPFKLFAVGLLFALVVASVFGTFFYLIYKILKNKSINPYFPVLALFIFTFLFTLATSFGRSGQGLNSAISSRYITFSIPAIFACYLTLCLLKTRVKGLILATFLFFMIFLTNQNIDQSYSQATKQHDGLDEWINCYLETKNIPHCNKKAKFLVLPEDRSEFLGIQIEKLEKKNLNVFGKK